MPQQGTVGHHVNRVGLVIAHWNAVHQNPTFDEHPVHVDRVGRKFPRLGHHRRVVQQHQSVGPVKSIEQHPSGIGFNVQFRDASAVSIADQQMGFVGPHEACRSAETGRHPFDLVAVHDVGFVSGNVRVNLPHHQQSDQQQHHGKELASHLKPPPVYSTFNDSGGRFMPKAVSLPASSVRTVDSRSVDRWSQFSGSVRPISASAPITATRAPRAMKPGVSSLSVVLTGSGSLPPSPTTTWPNISIAMWG